MTADSFDRLPVARAQIVISSSSSSLSSSGLSRKELFNYEDDDENEVTAIQNPPGSIIARAMRI